MQLKFSKYQATGNDFVLINDLRSELELTEAAIKKLCDRRFGIGADGLMKLQFSDGYDFKMVYYNSDGKEGSMCGNGGRCIALFAQSVWPEKNEFKFIASDGPHEALIRKDEVYLKMQDVSSIEKREEDYYLNTGSPHYVRFVNQLDHFPVVAEGRGIRFNEEFKATGTNVNFVELIDNAIHLRTYERGVEDETYSCGTGVTATALAVSDFLGNTNSNNEYIVYTKGGILRVRFKLSNKEFSNIWLIGNAQKVFEGSVEI